MLYSQRVQHPEAGFGLDGREGSVNQVQAGADNWWCGFTYAKRNELSPGAADAVIVSRDSTAGLVADH